jgi:hypothetical protein
VPDNTQGIVDVDLAVVFDEAQFLNLFMKNLTRGRVAPIISASISCDTVAKTFCGWPGAPRREQLEKCAPAASRWS